MNLHGLLPLTLEALLDAVRRRIVAVVVVVCILSVMVLDSCTACSAGSVSVNGEARSLEGLGGSAGIVTLVVLLHWIVVLTGFLASDHLRQTLEDGSALLSLSRPIGRSTFAFARLLGVLAIAFGTGAVLVGAAISLLAARSGLDPTPALLASALAGISCVAVGALSMAASLHIPRLATVMLVVIGVATVGVANANGLASPESSGALQWIDQLGPPILSSLVAALAPWTEIVQFPLAVGPLALRLLLWMIAALALLGAAFRRVELRG